MDALQASLLAGLATGLGALPLLFRRAISHRVLDSLVGLSAGMMLSAAAFGLIIPALGMASLYVVVFGIFLGAGSLWLMNRFIPHVHMKFTGNKISVDMRRALLIASAVTIHNFPEGFVVGAGYSFSPSLGLLLAVVIALQNIPEGLIIAVPLFRSGVSKIKCVLAATISGLVEPLAALFAVLIAYFIKGILPISLGFAAGAMLFIVLREMVPESHGHQYKDTATFAMIIGFVSMLVLQKILAS